MLVLLRLCVVSMWLLLAACSNTSDPTLRGSIAYSVCEDEHCRQEAVYVMNADGSNIERIATGKYPVWSPDGMLLAFMVPANTNAPLPLQVYIYDTLTRQSLPLHEGAALPSFVTWSPDGTRIALSASGETYGDRACGNVIWIVELDGTGSEQLTREDACDSDPVWSPDGARIAFTRSTDGQQRAYFAQVDGSEMQALPPDSFDPVWSPDGTQIAFERYVPEGEVKLFIADLDGTFRQLTDIEVENAWIRWSPDGTHIAFTADYALAHRLHLINTDGSDLRLILDTDWRPEELDWSPDGTRLVVSSFRLSTREAFLYTLRLDGSDGQMLTRHDRNSRDPDWGPEPSVEQIAAS